ncbi:MAG TPA: ATP-binding protein [Ohtaekwangia sp.]|nr:ATP-binding protein [Ohtaekwangia sp.]
MFLPGTKMHLVTFCIAAFEVMMLIIQVIYLLERPSDKRRLWYFFLLVLLILYNVCSGLFPDPNVPIPLQVQIIIAYAVGFTMSMYVVYYFYKVFELDHLKFFVTKGLLLFLLAPFLLLFVVPYLVTGDSKMSSKLTVVIPFIYGLSFIYCTSRALLTKFREAKKSGKALRDPLYEHAIVAYISMLCWAALPVIVFMGDYQVIEHSVTNAGFMLMTIIYVRSAIERARSEYQSLLKSQARLTDLNNNLQQKVEERTKSLEEAHERQTNTFINLAHETKTPLTLMSNYLAEHICQKGESKELKIMRANLHRITTDVTNFFDMSRLTMGFNIYDHSMLSDFSELLEWKIPLFKVLADKKGITLSSTIQKHVMTKANPSAIDRIINNLLENAVRYTPRGETVVITLARDEKLLRFSVSDSGPGIPEKYHQQVFEPYFQLADKKKPTEGMGMGLAIVKKIVDDLEGSIKLLSEKGSGTTIEVSLQLTQATHTEGQKILNSSELAITSDVEEPTDHVSNEDRPFIMIVEDNKAMLAYLAKKLSDRYNVIVAANGNEALKRLKSIRQLDLVISDVMMQPLDGIELCKIMSADSKFNHIPMIFLSAKSSPKDKSVGLRAGAVDFLEKPFRVDLLLTRVEALLSFSNRQRMAIVKRELTSIQSCETAGPDNQSAFHVNCKAYGLSARELEIVELAKKGHAYKRIADELFISVKTVNVHMKNIFDKCGVKSRNELISKLTE